MKLYRIKQTFEDHGTLEKEEKKEIRYIRIQPIDKSRQNSQGGQFFADWKIFLPANAKINQEDRIEFDSREYSIKQFYEVRDRNNQIHHIEILI